MKFPTLYGKTKAGKVKVWNVWTEQYSDGTACIRMEHGLEDGKQTPSEKYIKEGKNIGKSNETSPYEQSCSEAESRWNSQIDKGYAQSVSDIKMGDDREYFLPMLAVRQDQRGNKINWPAYVQPKLDGFRCLARKLDDEVELWSRKGKAFSVTKEIIADLQEILEEGEAVDGELYKHEWRSVGGDPDFQRISSAAKKYKPDTALLEYHIYDIPDSTRSFQDRFVNSNLRERILSSGSKRIKFVETKEANDLNDALEQYENWITGERPYEGAMVRNVNGLYMYDHRSNDLQKIKPLHDGEFEIIGGAEGTGNDSGTVVFRCRTSDNLEFSVRPTGSHESRAEYFQNLHKYIGQWLTVEYNGQTNDGKPRFPRGVKIRPDWDLDLRGKTDEASRLNDAVLKTSFNPFNK